MAVYRVGAVIGLWLSIYRVVIGLGLAVIGLGSRAILGFKAGVIG